MPQKEPMEPEDPPFLRKPRRIMGNTPAQLRPRVWRRILSTYDPSTDTCLWYSMKACGVERCGDGWSLLYRYVYEERPYGKG